MPATVDRAYLLAQVQQEVAEDAKAWAHRYGQARAEPAAVKMDLPRPTVKIATGDFWKDRLLRDYRRTNGLCFKYGQKYDPTHQYHKKPVVELQVAQLEDTLQQLSEEVLNMMELHDIAEAEQLSLSVHALSGLEASDTTFVRVGGKSGVFYPC